MLDGDLCQVRFSQCRVTLPVTTLVNVTTTGKARAAGGQTVAEPTSVVVFFVYGVVPQSRRNAPGDVHGVVDTAKAGAATDTMVTGRVQAAPRATVRRVTAAEGGRGDEVWLWFTFQRVRAVTAPPDRN